MKKHKGFTLLEVLIALAIFATAAVSVIRAVSQHINTIGYLEEKTFAAMVVDNQMAKVILAESGVKQQSGSELLAGRTWYWQVTPIDTANSLLKAFDVSVAVDKTSQPIVTVRSYVAQ